jgi:hypothetical protein
MPTSIRTFILACFFLSGISGLVYEILWTRMLVEIIGGAPFSVSIILTVFMWTKLLALIVGPTTYSLTFYSGGARVTAGN